MQLCKVQGTNRWVAEMKAEETLNGLNLATKMQL